MDSSQQPAFAQVENGEEAIAQKPRFSAKYQEGRFERSRTWLSGHDIKLNFESYGCGVKETSDYLKGPKFLFSCKSGLVYPISSATTWSQDLILSHCNNWLSGLESLSHPIQTPYCCWACFNLKKAKKKKKKSFVENWRQSGCQIAGK